MPRYMRKLAVAAALLGLALSFLPASAAPQGLVIVNFDYLPDPLRVRQGDVIAIVNADSVLAPHSVTSCLLNTTTGKCSLSGKFNSGDFLGARTMPVPATLSPGSYLYYCTVHELTRPMRGTLIVLT